MTILLTIGILSLSAAIGWFAVGPGISFGRSLFFVFAPHILALMTGVLARGGLS